MVFGLLAQVGIPTGMAEAVDSLAGAGVTPELIALFMGFFIVFVIIFVVMAIATYIYSSLALMAIAKRTDNEPVWLAWIPIGNLYLMSKIAKMHWWPILMIIPYLLFYIPGYIMSELSNLEWIGLLLILVSYIFLLVFQIYTTYVWWWKICEARNRPGWWALLSIIPLWRLVMMGILAWSKD